MNHTLQLEPVLPEQPKLQEAIEFMDLDSFALTQEELELEEIDLGGEEGGFGKFEDYGAGGDFKNMWGEDNGEDFAVDDDFFMAKIAHTQMSERWFRDKSKITQEVSETCFRKASYIFEKHIKN